MTIQEYNIQMAAKLAYFNTSPRELQDVLAFSETFWKDDSKFSNAILSASRALNKRDSVVPKVG